MATREKILILALPGIGDALLATPMIERLRAAKPGAEIHAFVMFSSTREMYEADPNIDRVHHYDFFERVETGRAEVYPQSPEAPLRYFHQYLSAKPPRI